MGDEWDNCAPSDGVNGQQTDHVCPVAPDI